MLAPLTIPVEEETAALYDDLTPEQRERVQFLVSLLRVQSPARKAFDKANAEGGVLVSTSTMLELYDVIRKPKLDKYISLERRRRPTATR